MFAIIVVEDVLHAHIHMHKHINTYANFMVPTKIIFLYAY